MDADFRELDCAAGSAVELIHGRVRLSLHVLRGGSGTPLLLLHELRASGRAWGELPAHWGGPVCALDFCGHGDSQWLRGGAYYPELLAGDADAALRALGSVAVAGVGLGAYVALLLAAGRPDRVRATLLVTGEGLSGVGAAPLYGRDKLELSEMRERFAAAACDPMVALLETDARPVEYVQRLTRDAPRLLVLEQGDDMPPWWNAVARSAGATLWTGDRASALQQLWRLAHR